MRRVYSLYAHLHPRALTFLIGACLKLLSLPNRSEQQPKTVQLRYKSTGSPYVTGPRKAQSTTRLASCNTTSRIPRA